VVNFDLGERFPRQFPATGELAPPHTACSRAGGGCPPPAEGVRGVNPGNFLGFLMPNPAFGGNLGQKIPVVVIEAY